MTTPLGRELVTNGGFEIGSPPTGWTVTKGTIAWSALSRYGFGRSCLFTKGAESGNAEVYQTVTLDTGWYTIAGWLYLPKNQSSQGLSLSMRAGSIAGSSKFQVVTQTSDRWQQVRVARLWLEGGTYTVGWFTSLTEGQFMYADDISLKRVSGF